MLTLKKTVVYFFTSFCAIL